MNLNEKYWKFHSSIEKSNDYSIICKNFYKYEQR